MNFHQKPGPFETHSGFRFRYEPVVGRESPRRKDVAQRILSAATAPILGSERIFPRRFNHVYERLTESAEEAEVNPEHAAWYFGRKLHLDLDPAKLKYRISDWVREPRGMHWVGRSFLDAGDWSAALSPLERSPIHREMHDIVVAGAEFRSTATYRNFLRAIKRGRPMLRNNVRLADEDAIEAYLKYCRGLIKSMRKRGALRRAVSGAFHGMRVRHWDARSPLYDSSERDIGVAIDADGSIIRVLGGKHRTAIAQALKLPTIPVEIRMVHVHWLRQQAEETGLPPHLALAEGVARMVARGLAAPAAKPTPSQG
jgi:hypothetical protein